MPKLLDFEEGMRLGLEVGKCSGRRAAMQNGIEVGVKAGIKLEQLLIARKLLKSGMDKKKVAQLLGLKSLDFAVIQLNNVDDN